MERSGVEVLYRLDDALSADERAVRQAVARVVDAEVLPVIGRHFREGTFPAQIIPRLGELGVLGANLSGYGCAGVSNVAYGLGLQELERG
ncbi:MAG: acyl-CoA dehydrogenase family protein, partial [Myxococcaceae bacterium]